MGGILYARRLARAKGSSGVSSGASSRRGRGDDHEKVPLTRVPSLHYDDEAKTGATEQQDPNFWSKAASITRARTPSLAGIGSSRFRGQEYSPERDVERDATLVAEPTTPTKASTFPRLLTGGKEPKSPKADKFSSRISGQASSIESGRRRHGDLASSVSAETLDHLMSIATAKIPGQAQKGPEPLRKRYVNKAAVGKPIVTTPIIPGEMARLVTPELLPVEEARARAADRSSGTSSSKQQSMDYSSPEPSAHNGSSDEDRGRPSREPLPVIEELSGSEESGEQRPVSPTSQRSKSSRPTSAAKRRTPSEGRRDSEESRRQGSPFPWVPIPPKIDTPLANELRRDLLSVRPVLRSSTSYQEVPQPEDAIDQEKPKRPQMRRRNLTEPDDDRRAQAEMGQTDLSPLNLKGLPLPSQQSVSTEGVCVPRYSSGSSWDASSGSSGQGPPMDSLASRSSGILWSGANVETPRVMHTQSQVNPMSKADARGEPGARENNEDNGDMEDSEEQDVVATIEHKQFSPRRISVAPTGLGHSHPRSSVWSTASEYSSRGSPEKDTGIQTSRRLAAESVAPLRLTPDGGRQLPSPPPEQRAGQHQRASPLSQQGRTTPTVDASEGERWDSDESPTSVRQEDRRISSISREVMGYLDLQVAGPGPAFTVPSSTAPPIKIDLVATPATPAKSVKIDFAAPLTSHAKSPPPAETLSTSRRTSSPRKPISPMLEDLQSSRDLFRGRKTATSPAHSPIAKPRIRFSDDVEVLKSPVASPAPTTSRVLTPATLPSLPSSRSRTPVDIISPQPFPRRGSVVIPSPGSVHSYLESSDNGPYSPANEPTDIVTPEPQSRQLDPLRQSTDSIPEEWQPRNLDPPRQSIESIPEEWKPRDLDAPEAVQTRDFWRELRRTSVTGYFVRAAQEEAESGQHDTEGQDSLR